MHWLYAIIFISICESCQSINGIFVRKASSTFSNHFESKSKSFEHLFRRIASSYFKDCALSIIYDSNYENHPIDFHFYFASTLYSMTQGTVAFSAGKKSRKYRLDKCTNYVIFLKDIFSLKHIISSNVNSNIVVVSSQTSWEIKDFLKSHISRFYKHLLIITRSVSRRHGDGAYLLYTHKLYTDGSGNTHPQLLTSWINNSITVKNIDLFPEKLNNGFMGHRLLVSTIENPPFTIKRSWIDSYESVWDGIEIRLFKLLASYLNFTVEFTESRSTNFSMLDSVMYDVSIGTTSAAIGGIYQTAELLKSFDTTTPFTEDCAAFISLASIALPKYRAILGPFQLFVWLLLCIAYFTLTVPLAFNSDFTVRSILKYPSKLITMFWFVFSTYTNSFIIKTPLLKNGIAKNSISLLLAIYWVFTIIITACYTGSIVAFITLPVYPSAIETADELLKYRYRIGTLDHNGWEKWFNVNTTDDSFLNKLFRKIEYVPSVLEGIHNASQAYFWPYAFLASKTVLNYVIQTDFAPTLKTKRSLMHISRECFVRYNVVQIFPAKSLYIKSINKFINRAAESGLKNKIIHDIEWAVQRITIKNNKLITKVMSRNIQVENRILTVEDTQGMFLIFGIGTLTACFALNMELLINFMKKIQSHLNNRKVNTSLTSSDRRDSRILDTSLSSAVKKRGTRGSI